VKSLAFLKVGRTAPAAFDEANERADMFRIDTNSLIVPQCAGVQFACAGVQRLDFHALDFERFH
jgi:hypothetical protein